MDVVNVRVLLIINFVGGSELSVFLGSRRFVWATGRDQLVQETTRQQLCSAASLSSVPTGSECSYIVLACLAL